MLCLSFGENDIADKKGQSSCELIDQVPRNLVDAYSRAPVGRGDNTETILIIGQGPLKTKLPVKAWMD